MIIWWRLWLALQYGVDAEQADMALTLPDLIQPASRLALARQLQARLLGWAATVCARAGHLTDTCRRGWTCGWASMSAR